jgi:hypothetical protein
MARRDARNRDAGTEALIRTIHHYDELAFRMLASLAFRR